MTSEIATQPEPTIYWAVVRNQTTRHTYIEIEHLGKNKWGVVLDDLEMTIKSDSPEFFDVLAAALTERAARLAQ